MTERDEIEQVIAALNRLHRYTITAVDAARERGFRHGYTAALADTYWARDFARETPERQAYIRSAGMTFAAPSSAVVTEAWEKHKHEDPGTNFYRVPKEHRQAAETRAVLPEPPEDFDWALDRVQKMAASALADSRVYGRKLLKGFGYPNEMFSRAQDWRALSILLAALSPDTTSQEDK